MASLRASLAAITARLDSVDELARDNAVKINNGLKATDKHFTEQLADVEERLKSATTGQKDLKNRLGRLDSAKATLTHDIRDLQGKVATLTETSSASESVSGAPPAPQPQQTDPSTKEGARIPVVVGRQTACTVTSNRDTTDIPPDRRPVRQDRRRDRRPTPCQILLTYSVQSDISSLVIGDSVLAFMTPDQVTTRPDERVQVIGVSGLKTSDLQTWLSEQPVSSHVQRVTLHIGVNDCKRGEVTSRIWDQIVDGCGQVFPLARIQISSIIPARGRLPMNSSISFSNSNLFHVCKRRGVVYIDNTSVFLTSRGAPRKSLYRLKPGDLIHPSKDGILALAANIKRVSSDVSQTDSFHFEQSLNQFLGEAKRNSVHTNLSCDATQPAACGQWAGPHTAQAVGGSPQWQHPVAPFYYTHNYYGGYADFSPPWMGYNHQ